MLRIIEITTFIVTVLFIWFKTDAFIEYCKLLSLFKKTVKAYDYTNFINFPQYLFVTYKNSNKLTRFITGLISCPVCLCLWLSIISCLFFNIAAYITIVFVLSLFIYFTLVRVMG